VNVSRCSLICYLDNFKTLEFLVYGNNFTEKKGFVILLRIYYCSINKNAVMIFFYVIIGKGVHVTDE
jgi:hypothetical protein